MPELADRCGWMDFYPHNQLVDLYLSYSTNSVAEGAVHVFEAVCINEDPSWYIENLSFKCKLIKDMETAVYEKLRPQTG